MTKEQILEKNFGSRFAELFGEWSKDQWLHAAMEDYAKQVLNYVLTRNHPDYELEGERIVMQDGCFWWISDEDGDDELTEERIIKLYENERQNNSK